MSLQLKPPRERLHRRALDALFREARLLERRRRRRRAAITLLLAGAGAAAAYAAFGSGGGGAAVGAAGVGGAAPGGLGARHVVTTLDLSRGDRYSDIARVGARLILSGSTPGRDGTSVCHVAVVDPRTLRLSHARSGDCDDPALVGERVLPIEVVERGSLPPGGGVERVAVRIAHVTSAPPGYRLGPVVMTFPQESTGWPGWVYGDGFLWLYDGSAHQRADLLRISANTGAVLARLTVPALARPLLAVDADGLWIAASANGSGRAVYRVGAGASAAVASFRMDGADEYAEWIVAGGHDVWLDVEANGRTETLWHLRGARAARLSRVALPARLGVEVATQGDETTVVGGSSGLWTALPAGDGREQRIVRIDQRTGAIRPVATLAPRYSAPSLVPYTYEFGAVTFDGSLFVLDPPSGSGFSALYRVTPRG